MIDFSPGNYFYVIFFVGDYATQDLMGAVWKDTKGRIILKYRFRYYKDDKLWDSEDKKNWYEFRTTEDRVEEIIGITKNIVDLSHIRFDKKGICDWVVVNGDPEKAADMLKNKVWVEAKWVQ